ncbi:MAG: DNA translocase FtsK 4TM domain-containing protein [Anaerolineae bacterium]|nr:DNA translocase FtsK 4TM domain-containing protein [Anaerolineae bacterium]
MVDRFRRGNKDDEGDDRPKDRRPGSKPPPDKKDDKPGDSGQRRFGAPGGGGRDEPAGGTRRPSGVGGGSSGSSDEGGTRRFGPPSFGRGGDDKDKKDDKDKDSGSRPGFGGFRRTGDEKKDDKPGDRAGSTGGRPSFGGDRPSGGGGSPFSRDRDADSGRPGGDRPGASPQNPRSTSSFGTTRDSEGSGGSSGSRPFGGGGGSPFNRDRDKDEKDEGGSGRSFGGGGSSFGRDRDADSGGRSGGGSSFGRDRDADSGGSGGSGSRLTGSGGSSFSRDRDADSGGGGRPGGDRPGGGGSPFSRDRDADSGGGGRPGGDRPGGGGSPFSRDRDTESGGGRTSGGSSTGSPERSSPLGGSRPGGGSPSSPSGPSSPSRSPFGGPSEGAGGRPASPSSSAAPARPGSSPPPGRPGISPSPPRPGSKPAEEPSKRALPGFGGRKEAPSDTPRKGDAKPKDEGGRRFGMPAIGRKSAPEEDRKKAAEKKRREEPPKRGTVEVRKDPKAAAKTSRATTSATRLPERADTGVRNVTRGLDYNRKLDLAGWGLLATSLVLVSGLLEQWTSSAPSGFTVQLDEFFAQLFGLGRVLLPFCCFVLGLWLVIRHFGKVIEIDYFRILGLGILFVTLLSTLQWWKLLWIDFPNEANIVPTMEVLRQQSTDAWESGGGGGLVGHTVYIFLQGIAGNWGAPFIMFSAWVLGVLFGFDLSFEKIATNVRTTRANRQAKREAALARYAESKGLVPSAVTATPTPSAPAMAVAAAVLATDESTGPQRKPGKTMGRTATPESPVIAQPALASAVVAAPVAVTEAVAESKEKRGMFGRKKEEAPTDRPITAETDGDTPKRAEKEGLFGRKKEEVPSDKPITADTDGDAPKRAERGGMFGRKKEEAPTDKPITVATDGETPKRALPTRIAAARETSEIVERQGSDAPKPAQPADENAGPRRPLPAFGGRSAVPEVAESKDKPAEPASTEPEGPRRRLSGLPGPHAESGDTGPLTMSAASETANNASQEELSGGRRVPGLRTPLGRQATSADSAETGKPAVANEAAPTADDQAGRRRFGMPTLPGRKASEPEKPAESGTSVTGTAAAVVAGMVAADTTKQPGRFGAFGRRGSTPPEQAKPAETSSDLASLKPVAAESEKLATPVAEKPAQPVAPRRGLPDLTPAERAMLSGETAPVEKPSESASEKPVAEAAPVVSKSTAPEVPKSETPEAVESAPVEPAAIPSSPETLAPVRRGFPQFTAAEAAMMGVAAATTSDAPKDETASEAIPPSAGRRPTTTPPRDLPGRQSAESGGLFERSAERTPPPSVRLGQPASLSNDDTQVVETNATQPIAVPSDAPSTPATETPRRSSPFARSTGDAPLFRPRATSEAPAASNDTEKPAEPVKAESGEPTAELSANPIGVALAGAALASDLAEHKAETPEPPPILPDQPAQPRGLPVRPINEPIARERHEGQGEDEATARLSHFQRAFGGETPAGEQPQRANFVPRREPLGRATGERPAVSPLPPASTETPTPAETDEDAGAMQPAQPRFARQNPFDHPEGETENIVPPVRAARPAPTGRPVSHPPQIGGANPDLDKTEITEGEEAETPARASLVPFTARRDRPAVVQQDIDDEDDDEDEDEVPAVVPQPVVARHHEPEVEPAETKSHANDGNGSSKWVRPDFMTVLEEGSEQKIDQEILLERAQVIEETLESFGAPGKVVEVNTGPVITQFGVEPDYVEKRGGQRSRVKVSAIAALDRDLALALAAKSIRIEAPVPGKGFVGIEVPNAETAVVSLRDVMSSEHHQHKVAKSKLAIGLGRRVDGAPISADLTEMPHLLIAGATGSGKSVCVNAIISCLLLQNTPDELQMIMVDPKRVELAGYNGLPHLVAPVVVDLERIVGVLKWVQREMDDRYKRFAALGARNIQDFNRKRPQEQPQMPYLVVIVDELADLMMLAPDETERLVARLAQMARATGIHLIISTQRPSVDVVTGLIKANFPARIAFAVASSVDSRVIIDQPGAEKLLGRGDMLFQAPDSAAPLRMQGVYLSDNEINRITSYWKSTRALKGGKGAQPERPAMSSSPLDEPAKPVGIGRRPDGGPVINDRRATGQPVPPGGNGDHRQDRQQTFWEEVEEAEMDSDDDALEGVDDLYDEAVKLVRGRNKASISMLQRHFRIGYTRSARLIDLMEERGVVGPAESGAKPRLVIPDKEGGEAT